METVFAYLLLITFCYLIFKLSNKLPKESIKRKSVNKTYLLNKITPEAQMLHSELIKLQIPAILERFDGYKTIDISIPSARIDIEVDGIHHNTNDRQAIAD